MPSKLKKCVQSVKNQGNSEGSAYAICSKSTGIKRKTGGWTKGKESVLKSAIHTVINEILQKQRGYVVASVDQSKQGYMPDTDDNIHILETFPFSKYGGDHQALESAIEYAEKNQANVYTLMSDGTYGEFIWPEDNSINEENQQLVNILKGKDYATINGLSYHLKECGCATTMGYKNGNHTLLVRRELLPLAIDSLKNTCDHLGQIIGERLEQKHFKKNEKIRTKKNH